MKLKQAYINLIQKIFTNDSDNQDNEKFNNLVLENPQILKKYQMLKNLWNEAENAGIFQHIDAQSDWQRVRAGLGTNISARHHRVGWSGYFLRIAAVLVIAFGLSLFIYKHLMSPQSSDDGFKILNSDSHIREFVLPDGSSITLNAGSTLTYNQTFGQQSRDVILEGEAYFDVMHIEMVPFRVFVRESVIEVQEQVLPYVITMELLK
jgi:transmembrane sensor